MCYVLAKDRNKHGCVALKARIGEELSELVVELDALAPHKGIEIVTISRPTAYGEYAPYSFVQTADELKEAVRRM